MRHDQDRTPSRCAGGGGAAGRARAARRTALIALTGSIALLCAAQLLAERAAAKQEALPPAVLALVVFLGALPTLATTQAVWGARARQPAAASMSCTRPRPPRRCAR